MAILYCTNQTQPSLCYSHLFIRSLVCEVQRFACVNLYCGFVCRLTAAPHRSPRSGSCKSSTFLKDVTIACAVGDSPRRRAAERCAGLTSLGFQYLHACRGGAGGRCLPATLSGPICTSERQQQICFAAIKKCSGEENNKTPKRNKNQG